LRNLVREATPSVAARHLILRLDIYFEREEPDLGEPEKGTS
jgi:hypothetical protein